MITSIKGIITAIVTPFNVKGNIDLDCAELLINKQIKSKISGIVIAGSTGEGTLLDKKEYQALLHCAVNVCKGSIPVIACCSHSSTNYVLKLAEIAQKSKVDALLCTAPNYTRPSQEGIKEHFQQIHDNVNLPIILYNIPTRTGISMSDDTISELAMLPKIIGIKDSTNDFLKPLRIDTQLQNFFFLGGDDVNALSSYANGATGLVSVISNLLPKYLCSIYDAFISGKILESLSLQKKLIGICNALTLEPNPVVIKYMMSIFGICAPFVRLPLCFPSLQNQEIIKEAIQQSNNLLE